MSSLTPAQMKALQQAEQKAILEAKNKAAARAHLLRIQVILDKKPLPRGIS